MPVSTDLCLHVLVNDTQLWHEMIINVNFCVCIAGTVRGQKSPAAEQQKLEDPTSVLKQDFRTFNCETWHLEPTVR